MRGRKAEPSRGVTDARRVREAAEASVGDTVMPVYGCGASYQLGDVVTEGTVLYARRVGTNDKGEERWRVIVVPDDDGPARTLRPSTTRLVRRATREPR